MKKKWDIRSRNEFEFSMIFDFFRYKTVALLSGNTDKYFSCIETTVFKQIKIIVKLKSIYVHTYYVQALKHT